MKKNIKCVSFLENLKLFFCRGYLLLTQTSENQENTEWDKDLVTLCTVRYSHPLPN